MDSKKYLACLNISLETALLAEVLLRLLGVFLRVGLPGVWVFFFVWAVSLIFAFQLLADGSKNSMLSQARPLKLIAMSSSYQYLELEGESSSGI